MHHGVFLTVGALGDPSAHALLPRFRDAVKELIGGVLAYLARDEGLFSREAILNAAEAFGERGHDLKVKDVAEWREQRKGLLIAVQMNGGYYSALSHFFPHSSGFALIRHVRTDGKLRRRPASLGRGGPPCESAAPTSGPLIPPTRQASPPGFPPVRGRSSIRNAYPDACRHC